MAAPLYSSARLSFLRNNLHIVALWAFAIAPLYNLLGSQAAFFSANLVEPLVIGLFGLTLGVLIPLLLIGFKQLTGYWGETAQNRVDWLLTATLFFLVTAGFTHAFDILPLPVWSGLNLVLAVGLTMLYRRWVPFQLFVRLLSISGLVFPLVFFFNSNATSLIFKPASQFNPVIQADPHQAYPPVIMVIFDELPLSALLDAQGKIDAARYPGFGALARSATWYSRAHTVGDNTLKAVPAILTGRYPTYQNAPEDLKNNLFTLLSATHTLHVHERVTQLCPRTLCQRESKTLSRLQTVLLNGSLVYLHLVSPQGIREALPAISHNWGEFGALLHTKLGWGDPVKLPTDHRAGGYVDRPAEFETFVARLTPWKKPERPPFYFIHILLPHGPYVFLPNGKYYGLAPREAPTPIRWQAKREMLQHYQRRLLQLQFTDQLLQQLLTRLKATGLYEQALLVVTADHGVSSRYAQPSRDIAPGNAQDILPVPLLIKLPHQQTATIIEKPVRTIDIVPTLTDLLKLPAQTTWDGQSMQNKTFPQLQHIAVSPDKFDNQQKSFSIVPWPAVLQAAQERLRIFKPSDSLTLFRFGPHADWVGKALSELPIQTQQSGDWHVELESAEDYQHFDPHGSFVPAMISGRLQPLHHQALPPHLLITVNQNVWATYPVLIKKGNRLEFYAMVPEEAFKAGENQVEVFIPNQNWTVLWRVGTP